MFHFRGDHFLSFGGGAVARKSRALWMASGIGGATGRCAPCGWYLKTKGEFDISQNCEVHLQVFYLPSLVCCISHTVCLSVVSYVRISSIGYFSFGWFSIFIRNVLQGTVLFNFGAVSGFEPKN